MDKLTIEKYFNLSQIERAGIWYIASKHSCNSYATIKNAMERARLDWLCNGKKLVVNCDLVKATSALSIYNQTIEEQNG